MVKKLRNLVSCYKIKHFEKILSTIGKITNGRLKITKGDTPVLISGSNKLSYGIMVTKNGKTEDPIVYIPIDEII